MPFPTAIHRLPSLLPGLFVCALVGAGAVGLGSLESLLFGRVLLEPLVLAILLGAAIRTACPLPRTLDAGLQTAAKPVLEFAIVLLGGAFGFGAVLGAGPGLLVGIAGVVATVLVASYALGRLFGLPHRLAILVACGNSFCGNSAIVAVAPTVGADGDEVARAIAFTAVLGILFVPLLPLIAAPLDLSPSQYGILTGLTVYAVPQVLAATAPAGAISTQIGTLVKLARVLLLVPVVFALSLWTAGRTDGRSGKPLADRPTVPWFILGFMALGTLRTAGIVADAVAPVLATAAGLLTLLSMAALGLGVDLRSILRAGGRVALTASLSLILLALASLALIRFAGFA